MIWTFIKLNEFHPTKIFLQSMSLLMHVHVGGEWWDLQGTPLKLYSSLLWWWTNFCFGKHENRKFLVQSLGGKNYGRYETFLNSKNIFNGESLSYLLAANEKNVSKEVHVLKNFSLQLKYRLKVQHILAEYQYQSINVKTLWIHVILVENDEETWSYWDLGRSVNLGSCMICPWRICQELFVVFNVGGL